MKTTPYLRQEYNGVEIIVPFLTIVLLMSFSLFIYPFAIHKKCTVITMIGDKRILVSKKEITIQVMKDCLKVQGDKRISHLVALSTYLKELPIEKRDISIRLIPYKGLEYEQMMKILRAIRGVGITKVIIEEGK